MDASRLATLAASAPYAEQDKERRKIGTHSGVFHADEALACFMLKLLPEYHNAQILRRATGSIKTPLINHQVISTKFARKLPTQNFKNRRFDDWTLNEAEYEYGWSRDPEVYNKCDIVVDLGGVYDASQFRFDHHQRGFTDTMNSIHANKPWTIKLSSAGLIYCHFGRRCIAEILGLDVSEESHARKIELIYDKVYDQFIAEMDAIDNGVPQSTSDKPFTYQINTGLSSRVKRLNPRWNEEDKSTDSRFTQAMQLTGAELVDKVNFYWQSWLPAREIVERAVLERYKVDVGGEIIRLQVGGCPWQDHLVQIEAEHNGRESSSLGVPLESTSPINIKYVLYQDDQSKWRVQAVPLSSGSFASRLPLPEEWRGLVNEKLSQVAEIPECIFAHHSGFIGGNSSYDGALQMARKALMMARETSASQAHSQPTAVE